MNHNNDEPGGGIHVNMTTMADMLKSGGYRTLHLGKWHLGMSNEAMTPQSRGFDESLGFFAGSEDHYTQIRKECVARPDLWDTDGPAVGMNNTGYGKRLLT